MASTSSIPGNYAQALLELQQKQQQAEQLKQAAAQPFQANPQLMNLRGHASAMAAISPIANALLGMKMGSDASTGVTDVISQRQHALATAMQNYMDTAQGRPATATPYATDNPFGEDLPKDYNVSPAVAADPRKALVDALSSQFPEMQQLGQSVIQSQLKSQVTAKDLLPYLKRGDIPAAISGVPVTSDMMAPDLKTVGNVAFDPDTLKVQHLDGGASNLVNIGGDLYQTNPTTGQLQKLDNATKISVNASPTIVGQRAGLGEFYKNAANQIQTLGQTAQKAQEMQQSLAQLQELDKGGVYSNATSGPITFISNLAQAVGIPTDPSKLGNTEAYNAVVNQVWQNLVSQMGGNRGVTESEAAQIKQMLPLAAQSPQARQELFAILNKDAQASIERYQTANKAYGDSVTAEDPRIFVNATNGMYLPSPNQVQPVPAQQAKPNQPTVSNW